MFKSNKQSRLVLRAGLAFVFLWFGYKTFTNPTIFASLVPAWTAKFLDSDTLLKIHGAFEIIFGLFLLIGWKTKLVAGLLLLSLIGTILNLSYGPIMVRDIGLAAALLSIFLQE